MILLLPARVPSSRLPSETWHNTNVTRLDTVGGNLKPNAFDGALFRRLCVEYPVLVKEWRLVLHLTGVIRRGHKTLKQLDVERWDYATVAALVGEYLRQTSTGKGEQLPLFEAA